MPDLRGVRPEDLDDLYDVCLRTGAAGEDATDLFASPRLLGDLFVAPYAVLEPEHAFVVHDGVRVQGYTVGALDSRSFEARCEAEWFPAARERHANDLATSGFEALF
ncbi:MAG: GNAT family N-acetyltransferase, partial [Actinomycetota bacterium]|nr:GNAT family N-acetyltransferase [Actinomycetota bacterium]